MDGHTSGRSRYACVLYTSYLKIWSRLGYHDLEPHRFDLSGLQSEQWLPDAIFCLTINASKGETTTVTVRLSETETAHSEGSLTTYYHCQ